MERKSKNRVWTRHYGLAGSMGAVQIGTKLLTGLLYVPFGVRIIQDRITPSAEGKTEVILPIGQAFLLV